MTSDLQLQPGISSRTFLACGMLSLVLHTGLLTGLAMIQRTEPIIETAPLINVTLVPHQSEPSREAPDSIPPPMRTAPRPSPTNPTSQPIQPRVSQSQPIATTSALALTTISPTLETLNPPSQKRILKDTLSSNALFAQSATKMVKRSTMMDSMPLSVPKTPHTNVFKIPEVRALSPGMPSNNTASAVSLSQPNRRLITQPPASLGSGSAKIVVRHSVPPVYPRVAKEEGWEGIVLLRVLVQTSGVPEEITIQKSSGHAILDEAAIEAIRKWRFTPAMDGNFPIEKYLQIPLNFGLHR